MGRKLPIGTMLLVMSAAALAAFLAYAYGVTHPLEGDILDVRRVGGGVSLDIVQYADGRMRGLAFDNDAKVKIGEVRLPAMRDADGKIYTPNFTSQGDVWQRGAFTYDDPGHPGCQRHIIYVSRTEKRISQASTPYCINSTVDQHDITLYFGFSEDGKMMAIGEYDGGKVWAAAPAIEPFDGLNPAWDNSRMLMFHPADPGSGAWAKMWYLGANVIKDIPLPKQLSTTGGSWYYITYDNEKDRFVAHNTVLPKGNVVDYVLNE